jgi:hypothetical protein
MRSKTFRKKHGKMSRRRRAGQPNGLTRTTSAELNNMEEGNPVATRPMLGRSTTGEMSRMEEGYAPTAPPMELMDEAQVVEPSAPPIHYMHEMEDQERARDQEADRQRLFRSNTQDLSDMESGNIDIESGVRKERGGRKKRTRKGRKGRKTRKGRKKSHRR